MTTQLRLLDGGHARDWLLDARTKRIGRNGVAKARQALDAALARQAERDGAGERHLRAG